MFRCAALMLVMFACGPSAAHELWLQPLGEGSYHLHWGHADGDDHGGAHGLRFELTDVVEAWGAAPGSPVHRIEARRDGDQVRLDGCADFVAVRMDAGTWVKTRRGTVRGRPGEVEGALHSWRSSATVKRVAHLSDDTRRPRLQGLEITPLDDPAALDVGDKIDLRVTLGAVPVAEVVVTYAGRPRGTTDRDGTIRLKMRDAGVQRFGASHTVTDVDPDVDRTIYEAFLEIDLGGSR